MRKFDESKRWVVSGQSDAGRYIKVTAFDSGKMVARVPFSSEADANAGKADDDSRARLIAAAPEILAALRVMYSAYSDDGIFSTTKQRDEAVRIAGAVLRPLKGI